MGFNGQELKWTTFFSGSFIIGEVHQEPPFGQSRVMASDREGTFPKSVYSVCWCWGWRVDNDRSISYRQQVDERLGVS